MSDINNLDEQSDPQTTDATDAVQDEVSKLRAERDQLFERLARTTAEYQNSRKRLEGEMDQRMQFANSNLIKSLIPVIEDFERALAQDPTKLDSVNMLKGMQMVHDKWMSILKQQRVEEIAPKEGDTFDPNQHQAVMQQDDERFKDRQVVLNALQKGYILHDRVLRPAAVTVSKVHG